MTKVHRRRSGAPRWRPNALDLGATHCSPLRVRVRAGWPTAIARLNEDSSPDTTFVPPANLQTANVTSIVVQADGKIVIGGTFTEVGGQTPNQVARLNANGSLDAGFDPNVNNTVWAIVQGTRRQVIPGGVFTSVGGMTRNRLARVG